MVERLTFETNVKGLNLGISGYYHCYFIYGEKCAINLILDLYQANMDNSVSSFSHHINLLILIPFCLVLKIHTWLNYMCVENEGIASAYTQSRLHCSPLL